MAYVLSASYGPDNLVDVPAEEDALLRSKVIRAPRWWRLEARKRVDAAGMTQETLAKEVARLAEGRDFGDLGPIGEVEQSRISRCLRGSTSPVSMMQIISEIVRLPPPVFVTESLAEAREMASVAASYRSEATARAKTSEVIQGLDRQLGEVEAGVSKIPSARHPGVLPRHGGDKTRRRS